MTLNGYLEGEVDGVVSILNVEQQNLQRIAWAKFLQPFDKGFLLIRQVHRFVLVFDVVLCSVRI